MEGCWLFRKNKCGKSEGWHCTPRTYAPAQKSDKRRQVPKGEDPCEKRKHIETCTLDSMKAEFKELR